MTATDTITPTATAMRAKLIANAGITALVSQRVYLGDAPDNAAYPHIIMKAVSAPEMDATHDDLSWQAQQWDIYAVADTMDIVNDITGKIAGVLDAQQLTLSGGAKTLVIRRQGTMPASRIKLSDTISKMIGATTLLVGIRTGSN
mgnify:CR=1 FL=1